MNKGVVYFIIGLVLLAGANAVITDPSRAVLSALEISCNSTANLQINVSHSGINIKTKDIKMTATHVATNTSIDLTEKGLWSTGFQGSSILNQTENNFDSERTIRFFSDPLLTSKGEYVLKVEWTGGIQDWQTKILKAFDCPGMQCSADGACESGQKCSNGRCEYIACSSCDIAVNHKCSPKCDDGNPCTQDACGEGGKCLHVNSGNCCKFDDQCNDNDNCTTDRCSAGKCLNDPLKCARTIDPCVVGVCTEGKGCVYTTDKNCQLRHKTVLFRVIDWFLRIFS